MFTIPTETNIAEIDQNIGTAKTQVNNSSKNLNKIKGISQCFECEHDNIIYDEDIDEIYCYNCGLVLRQGIKDYRPTKYSTYQITSQEHKRKLLNRS